MRTIGIYCSSILFTLAVAAFAAPPDADAWSLKVQPLPGPVTLAELTGEWYKSHMSTVDFVNPSTGAHAAPSGERFNIHFYLDGTYKSGWLLQSSLYNCSTTVFAYKTGVYRLEGSTITLEEKTSSLKSRDTCHAQWNYEKNPPLRTVTYQIVKGATNDGPVMIFRTAKTEDVFAKETGKSLLGE